MVNSEPPPYVPGAWRRPEGSDPTRVHPQAATGRGWWIEESDDQGRFPEDPAIARFYEEQGKRNYGARIEALRREWGIAP